MAQDTGIGQLSVLVVKPSWASHFTLSLSLTMTDWLGPDDQQLCHSVGRLFHRSFGVSG